MSKEEAKSSKGIWAFFKKCENDVKNLFCLSCKMSRIINKRKKNDSATWNYHEEERVSEIFEWYENSWFWMNKNKTFKLT